MKVLVISDIHGSGYYAEKIKEINEREKRKKKNLKVHIRRVCVLQQLLV